MSELLDESYLTWLYSQVASVTTKERTRTYWGLFKQLYTKEFVWFVPNDDNRVEDGRALRNEFLNEKRIAGAPEEWLSLGCSMLELLVGLARRLSFETDREPRVWFWKLLDNIGLGDLTDASVYNEVDVDAILERVIFRTYAPSGDGGLFPLAKPSRDQRKVELWYQLCEYVLENN